MRAEIITIIISITAAVAFMALLFSIGGKEISPVCLHFLFK